MQQEELVETIMILDEALGFASQLGEAIRVLIPSSPDSLSPENRSQWQKVVNVIYASAEFSETAKFQRAAEIVEKLVSA